jgi:hypothetical protein
LVKKDDPNNIQPLETATTIVYEPINNDQRLQQYVNTFAPDVAEMQVPLQARMDPRLYFQIKQGLTGEQPALLQQGGGVAPAGGTRKPTSGLKLK